MALTGLFTRRATLMDYGKILPIAAQITESQAGRRTGAERFLPQADRRKLWPVNAFETALRDPGQSIIVATRNGAVAGFAHCIKSALPGLNEALPYIELLGVDRDSRRQGAGRALLQASANWARLQKGHVLTLDVMQSNAAAGTLYHKAGFQTVAHYMDRVVNAGEAEAARQDSYRIDFVTPPMPRPEQARPVTGIEDLRLAFKAVSRGEVLPAPNGSMRLARLSSNGTPRGFAHVQTGHRHTGDRLPIVTTHIHTLHAGAEDEGPFLRLLAADLAGRKDPCCAVSNMRSSVAEGDEQRRKMFENNGFSSFRSFMAHPL